MKIISFLFLLIIISVSHSFGEVLINLRFTDSDNIGFNDHKNKWMINEAMNVATLVGKLIKQNASINIQINATHETPCAWAPAEYYHTITEKYGKKVTLSAQKKILNNDMTQNNEFNGHIEFNMNKFHEQKRQDFRQIVFHELTHVLGFLNFQQPNSSQISYYNDFDKLLYDKNGNPFLINEGDFNGNYFINPRFNCSLEMYACGNFIQKQNGGKCAKIYNPKVIEVGSSFAHLDSVSHPRSIMASRRGKNEYRIWNNFELSIMQELGYEIDWDNYYQIFQELYPSTITVNIDKGVLEGTDTHFEIQLNEDFPKTCFQPVILDEKVSKKFSVAMNQESKLVLVDNKSKMNLFVFHPFFKTVINKLYIINEKYKADLKENPLKHKLEYNIKFTI